MDAAALWAVAIRAVGAILGAGLALIFLPPKNRAEFWTRGVFSVICGAVGGYPVQVNYLHWPDDLQMLLAAATLVSALSWFCMGAVIRIIGKWMPPKE